jgi:hypothetical protein
MPARSPMRVRDALFVLAVASIVPAIGAAQDLVPEGPPPLYLDRALSLDPFARPPRWVPRASVAGTQPTAPPTRDLTFAESAIDEPQNEESAIDEPIEGAIESAAGASDDHRLGAFALSAGIAGGFAYVTEGMPADSARPPGFGATSPWIGCDDHGQRCDVRVEAPGFGTTFAVVVAALIEPVERVLVGVTLHAQPSAGSGFLAGWLLDATLRVRPLAADDPAIDLELVVRAGVGQLQPRPPQDETDDGPFVRSGPGNAAAGAALVIAIEPGVELLAELSARLAFPEVLFSIDPSLSLRIRP